VVVDDGVCTFTAEDWEKIKAKLPPWMLKVPMPSLLSTLDGMKRLG
jgi:hypothetical protein